MKRTIEKIVDYARIVTDPDKIILFGSAATGMANAHSDIDLLIVVESSLPHEETSIERINSFAREISLKVDVLIRTNTQMNEEILQPDSFLKSIYQHGKKMYEKR